MSKRTPTPPLRVDPPLKGEGERPALPQTGGAFVRQKDGTLVRENEDGSGTVRQEAGSGAAATGRE